MKKLLLLLLLFPTLVWGADTCTEGTVIELGPANSGKYEVLFTCTADTSGNFAYTLSDGMMDSLAGKYIYRVASANNTVSEGAEFEIRDSFGRVFMAASGNGKNFLSQSAYATEEYTSGPNTDDYRLVGNYRLTFYAENIGASGGAIYILFTLVD